MPRLVSLAAVIAVAVAASGCGAGLEKQSHVSKLRVLAVRADPPELVLAPGEPVAPVELTALAVAPDGAPVEVEWALCDAFGLPPADLDCPGRDALLALAPTSPASARLDPGALPADAGPGPAAPLALVVGFRASTADASLHGFATLPVRPSGAGTPVRNPTVLALTADGDALPEDGPAALRAGATVRLAALADEDPVTFSFYATAGDLEALRATSERPDVEWQVPDAPGPVRLWVVARDGRGGVGWLARTVQVVP